jgi:hypothetical protein
MLKSKVKATYFVDKEFLKSIDFEANISDNDAIKLYELDNGDFIIENYVPTGTCWMTSYKIVNDETSLKIKFALVKEFLI